MREPTEREIAVLDALTAVARPIILTEFRADSCIASTKVALDALAYFGIHAKEMPVFVMLANAEALRLMEEGLTLPELHEHIMKISTSEPGGPWTVGVGGGDGGPQKWSGHLIAAIPSNGVIVDLSLDQASRPHKNMTLTPYWARVEAEGWWAEPPTEPLRPSTSQAGTLVLVDRRTRDPRGYRTSPNWNIKGAGASAHRMVTGKVIEAVRAHLD